MSDFAQRQAAQDDEPAAVGKPRLRPARIQRRWRHTVVEWMLVAAGVLALLAAGIALTIIATEQKYTQRIYPGVAVRGIAIGDRTRDQAYALIATRYAPFLQAPLELTYANQRWRPTAAELGLRLDIEGALAAALLIGREDSRVTNLRQVAATWEAGIDLPLTLTIDEPTLQAYLQQLATQIERPVRDADVRIEQGTVIVTQAEPGVQLLINESITDFNAVVQSLTPQPVALRTRRLAPAINDAAIAPIVEHAQRLLHAALVLTSPPSRCPTKEGCRWEWTPQQLAHWIELHQTETGNGSPGFELRLNEAAMRRELVPIAAALHVAGGLPRLDWNNGKLAIAIPGTPGRGLDMTATLAQMRLALEGDKRVLDLPLVTLPPPVNESNLATLGLVEPIGVGISSFAKSQPYRITNIRAGAKRMHGMLIPPNTTFSFNDNLGAVDAEHGFVEGSAIVANRTQTEWGGGVCQVSTTLFRSAFWAGLPIDERHEHAFRISWYEELGEPPGLDATIFTGITDLRFTNDTGNWLLIQSSVDLKRQRLTMTLYGTNPNRQVAMDYRILERMPAPTKPLYVDDPALPHGVVRQTDTARSGLRVEVYRVVRANGRILRRDTFPTEFRPWPNIFVRGTG